MATAYGDAPNRAVAMVVDLVLLTVLITVVAAVVGFVAGPVVTLDPDAESVGRAVRLDRAVAAIHALLSVALGGVYFAGSWVRGATPAMRLLGMGIVDARSAERVGPRAAFVRWVLVALPFGVAGSARVFVASGAAVTAITAVVVGWYAVLLVSTARSATKQGVHDRIAGTIVTKAVNVRAD